MKVRSKERKPYTGKIPEHLTLDRLHETTRQIFLGSLLGDGCVTRKSPTAKLHFFQEMHCPAQEPYVKWKCRKLSVLRPRFSRKFSQHYDGWQPALTTGQHEMFSKLRGEMYGEDGRKRFLPDDLIEQIDLLGLLVWYLDDGCNGHAPDRNSLKPVIVAKGYREPDREAAIQNLNERLGLRLTPFNHGIRITAWTRDKIWPTWVNLFEKHRFPECMRYKLQLPALRPVGVRSVLDFFRPLET